MLFLCEESKPYVGCCPYCSRATVRKSGVLDNDRYVHDVNRGNICVDILLKCRRYRCENCGATFVHPFESIVEGSQLTKRLLAQIRSESFENTFQSSALRHGYSVPTISNIFESYAAELEAARGPIIAPRVPDIDEKHIVNAARGVFVNGETGVFLEMTPDNKEKTVIKTIQSMVDYDKNTYISFLLPAIAFHLLKRQTIYFCMSKHRLTRAHREKQLKMSCQALHNAPPNRT